MQHSIYWIHHPDHTNMFTQGYVGITKRFERRMWEHLTLGQNRYLTFAIKKYGWDNLIKEKVIIASKEYCLDIESKIRATAKIGWNLVAGGGMPPLSIKGRKHNAPAWNKNVAWSDEIRESIRKNVTKLWENPEYRQRMSDAHKGQISPMAGKKHSKESLLQISISKLGKPSKKKGKLLTKEQKQHLSDLIQLQPKWVCPHCSKEGHQKGAANRWHFDNCRFIKEKS
jgi:group I intron endonuclease